MRTEVKSTKANNSTLTAPVPELQDILNLSNREIAKSFCRIKSFSYLCNATEPYCTVYKVHKSLFWAYLRCASTPCSGGSVARIGGAPSFYAIN